MEKRDLYNIDRKLTGKTIYKGEEIPEGNYILVVLAFIRNSKGELLVQKRSKEKGGEYGFTGGHAKTGENSLQAIRTEITEELGIKVNDNELELVYSGRSDRGQTFFDIYYIEKDIKIEDMTLQKEEVEFVEWDSIAKIQKYIDDGLVIENHIEEFYRIIEIFKEKGINI